MHQWTFKNDGMHFRDQDWNRLKKIGMYHCLSPLSFGTNDPQRRVTPTKRRSEPLALVSELPLPCASFAQRRFLLGFYSLFSVTEEPFVTSGGRFRPSWIMRSDHLFSHHRSMDALLLERRQGPGIVIPISSLHALFTSSSSCL